MTWYFACQWVYGKFILGVKCITAVYYIDLSIHRATVYEIYPIEVYMSFYLNYFDLIWHRDILHVYFWRWLGLFYTKGHLINKYKSATRMKAKVAHRTYPYEICPQLWSQASKDRGANKRRQTGKSQSIEVVRCDQVQHLTNKARVVYDLVIIHIMGWRRITLFRSWFWVLLLIWKSFL